MAKLIIENWVDWGKAFVDLLGSFYCQTTDAQKEIAAKVARGADLWIYVTDVHSRGSSEFIANGGPFPAHNLVRKDWVRLDELGVEDGKTASPELTDKLQEVVKGKPSGLIVPRHVFFQDYDGEPLGRVKPAFSFEDVEQTFGVRRLDSEAFLDGAITYVINAKHMFNGAGIQTTEWMGPMGNVPDMEMNAFSLLKEKYGQGKGLVFNHTGVVMGICIYQTASNVKQIFPKAEVNVIADGATHLLVKELGFGDEATANSVLRAMCKQVNVNYITSAEYLGEK